MNIQTCEEIDLQFMYRAVALAEKGRVTAPPNPWVGCILVQGSEIVGEGFHHSPGTPHAEVHALAQAREKARGATAYTTLEPCSHQGRTGPCVEALIRAGVTRVVVGIEDPDVQVRGQGIQRLRYEGIDVEQGVARKEVEDSLAPYLHHRRTGRAYCLLKAALSLDGYIALQNRSSQWITGEEARRDAHRHRLESQAIAVGAGTAQMDHPSLTVREVPLQGKGQPIRVLFDAQGRVLDEGPLFDTSLAPTLVFTSKHCSLFARTFWKRAGCEICEVPSSEKGVDLKSCLEVLGKRGVLQVLIEGGSALYSQFFAQHLADALLLYHAGCFLGQGSLPFFALPGSHSLECVERWHLQELKQVGEDLCSYWKPRG